MSTIVAQNLFGRQQQQTRSAHLVEFKAGKMRREQALVNPDPRKGLVYITRSEDQLLHFCWKDRTTGTVEDDLIVFPDEAEWVKVSQASNGRVFMLRFKSSSQRLFFWMQDLKADKDEEISKKVNALLSQTDSSSTDEDSVAEQNQLLQLLQSQGLLEPLQTVNTAQNTVSDSSSASSLTASLTPELLAPVLADESMRQQLFPLLPESHAHTKEELVSVIRSPQFQQAVEALDSALQSGQLGPLLAELGLDPNIAVSNGDRVMLLLRAIKEKKKSGSNKMETD